MFEASRLSFDPIIPWLALWALIAVSAVLWGGYVWRGGKAWLFRAIALSILALALANPLWVEEEREPLKDIVALVIDRSESMNFRGRTETAQAAYDALKTQIEADETLELRVSETDPDADGSDVYTALQSALSDAPRDRVAGALIVTDGQVHNLPSDPETAVELGPVHSLIVGGEDEIDRRIEIQSIPSFGIVDNGIDMRVQVDDPTAEFVDVAVSINGDIMPPQRIATGEPQTIPITLKRRGDNLVVVQVAEIPNELTLANNLASAAVSGVQDRLRVLLVTGEPHTGARVWRDLLKSDPAVDLVHFTILRPPEKTDNASTDEIALINFPRRQLFRDKLDEFDLVIFDHELRSRVLEPQYLARVARYVENGGALLVAAGPPYPGSEQLYNTPLVSVLPGYATGEVVEQKFAPELTELGRRHSVTATLDNGSVWGPWLRYMRVDAGNAETLIQAPDGAPLLLLDRVEDGRVAAVMSDQIWLWARGFEGGGPYAELIRRTAHWLMKEPELEEELLQLRTDGADRLGAELRTLTEQPEPLSLIGPDGQEVTAEWALAGPGLFRTQVDDADLGLFRASSGDLRAVAVRGPAHPREYVDLRSTTELLQPFAASTLGGVFRVGADGAPDLPDVRRVGDRGNAAGSDWLGLRRNGGYAVRATQTTQLIPGVVGMGLAVFFMMFAWWREGR